MSRINIAVLVALLTTTIELVAVSNTAASQSDPPSVTPSWGYSSEGCSGWSVTDRGWTYSCAAYGDTWVFQAAYYWDSDLQSQFSIGTPSLIGWTCGAGRATCPARARLENLGSWRRGRRRDWRTLGKKVLNMTLGACTKSLCARRA
jgi:hypothetical protein